MKLKGNFNFLKFITNLFCLEEDRHTPKKMNSTYWWHQIYGDFPSVILRDDTTMDSFNRRSPWAVIENDSPFVVRSLLGNGTELNMTSSKDEEGDDILDLPIGMECEYILSGRSLRHRVSYETPENKDFFVMR